MRTRSSFRFKTRLTLPFKVVALALVPIQAVTVTPVRLVAAVASVSGDAKTVPLNKTVAAIDPTLGVKVNRTLPVVTTPKALSFSDEPTDAEFFNNRVFPEPLIPVGGKRDADENRALALAITNFSKAANAEDTDLLTAHLVRFPNSPWRASLLANLGAIYRSTAYWSKALKAWEESWSLLHGETDPKAAMLADFVLGELAQLNARLGRFDRLESLFQETAQRDVRGPATEKVAGARQGLALMNDRPQDAFRCGPMALERILRGSDASVALPPQIFKSRSTRQGMSLAQVNKLAAEVGMKYQMAKRSPGAKIIYPSVINWRVGHFAALTKEVGQKFLAQDPTFNRDVWISEKAIDEEGSGYYLVPAGRLPTGWRTVSVKEGGTVWGKGNAGPSNEAPPPCVAASIKQCPSCLAPNPGTPNPGMADYNVDAARISLSISDTPVGYTPPRGPAVNFTVYYQQREIAPVSTPTYSNLGNKWSFAWLGYLVVDPTNELANAVAYGPGGGTLSYLGFNSTTQSYAPQFETNVVLAKMGPGSYEKRFPDGSRQIFSLSDGATVYPQMVFMTQSIDPQGNTLTYTYDGSFRLVALSDALGQVTILSYDLGSDPLKVTKVTDPFGRVATLEYDINGLLWKVTDTIGIVSEFTYTSGDFISKMTTPYGVTTFVAGATTRSLEITDPKGGKERVEYNESTIPNSEPTNQVPPGAFNENLSARNTFYWDKKAMAELHPPLDYTKARITHWLHSTDLNVASGTVESSKLPFENRVFMAYTGGNGFQVGSISKPASVSRVLDDGTVQAYQYEYNILGKVSKYTDPIGRATSYVYDASGVDLLEVRQTTGSLNELLANYTYNGQHLPLTATDASGQTTIYTYYPSGQIHTVTNAKQETTSLGYDPSGYFTSVTGPVAGATRQFAYDGFGRLRTTIDSEGYTRTADYDAIGGNPTKTLNRVAKVTYPDGTFEQITYDRLDPEWTRDRLGRWSRKFYDSLRHVIAAQDHLNRITSYDWCGCGGLKGLTDANGNTTSWTRDIQGRVTDKVYPDSTHTHYTYEVTTSRLASKLDAKNQSTNYLYFVDNNVQQIGHTNAQVATPNVSYTHDSNYNRLSTMTDGIGLTTYSYNLITTPPALGAGRLATVDGPLTNDTIAYSYDELGRTTGHSINGAVNTGSSQFDSLGRLQTVSNPLGTFNYTYVNTTGRVDHVDFPNGQKTQFTYFDNLGDQRLKQIKNLNPSAGVISQFDYTYNLVGNITTWTQADSDMANSRRYDFGYDAVDQLRNANLTDTVTQASVHQYDYDYDAASNRRTAQRDGAVTSSGSNGLNQITSQAGGGEAHFRGKVNEPAAVTVAGTPASVDAFGNFNGVATVNVGANTVAVAATDANGNNRSNNYQVTVPSEASKTLSYDLNGNLTSDGDKTYEWDGADRLVAINYVGTSNRSEFSYDGLHRRVKVVEKTGGVATSTKNLILVGSEVSEERDASNNVTKRYYAQGMQVGSNTNYYARDHLGSIRELTDSSGAIHARYDYDPYGRRTKTTGTSDADFGFTGYYYHQASTLHFALYRAYAADLGRWISRDPILEAGGLNLYGYSVNDPVNRTDPSGLLVQSLLGWSATAAVGTGVVLSLGVDALVLLSAGAILEQTTPELFDPFFDSFFPQSEMPPPRPPTTKCAPPGFPGDEPENHHRLPQEFKEWFEAEPRNLNIEDYTTEMEMQWHRGQEIGIHSQGYNSAWRQFISENPTATQAETLRFLKRIESATGFGH
jgi:RHS repeat-associated protein